MALTSRSEDILEALVFGLGVAISEAEGTRMTDPAEFRARMASLCKKWRGDVESLISATDPTLHAGVNLLSARQENAALKQELEALKNEIAELKAENAKLRESPAPAAAEPAKAPAPKKTKEEPKAQKEEPKDQSEFSAAMKDVKRY
jgi:transposase-like protein